MAKQSETTHVLIDKELLIYRRSRSGCWQCRFKLGRTWKRLSTKKINKKEAIQEAYRLFKNSQPDGVDDFVKTKVLSFVVPKVVVADDYHKFDYIKDTLYDLGLDVSVTEIGFANGKYQAVIHEDTYLQNQFVDEARKNVEAMLNE